MTWSAGSVIKCKESGPIWVYELSEWDAFYVCLLAMSVRLGMNSCHFFAKMPELENFTECIDLVVFLVLEDDFGSVTAAFSSLHRSLTQIDFTPHILKDGMAISLSSKAPC